MLLLPFGTYLAKLATLILPEKKENKESSLRPLSEEFRRGRINLGAAAVHTDLLRHEIERMVLLAGENVHRSYEAVLTSNLDILKEVDDVEETLDTMNKEISQYISQILVHNNSTKNVSAIKEYFLITGNAERIGDHAANIAGYVKVINDKCITFSDMARSELLQMQEITKNALERVLRMESDTTQWLSGIAALEQKIDDMTITYREQHLERMHQGLCSEEACIIYSELLTDFERIGDHILNIAQAYSKIHINA